MISTYQTSFQFIQHLSINHGLSQEMCNWAEIVGIARMVAIRVTRE